MPVEQARPKPVRSDPGAMIAKQIAALTGDRASLTVEHERPWASITFSGTRHSFRIEFGTTGDLNLPPTLCKALADHEFVIPGYFVADILVKEKSADYLLVEALSIIDPLQNGRNH